MARDAVFARFAFLVADCLGHQIGDAIPLIASFMASNTSCSTHSDVRIGIAFHIHADKRIEYGG
jgi:hypothetical protein